MESGLQEICIFS